MIVERKTIFDIVREADEDTADNIIDGSIDDNSSEDNNTNTDNKQDSTDDDTNNNEDDFKIDASLDDIGGIEDNNVEGNGDKSSSSSNTSSNSSSSSNNSEEEAIPSNTNIFSNLSAEEQSIKISELKRLYNELYTSCDDSLEKINNISPDVVPITTLSRISQIIHNLRQYIKDYIISVFPIKSYIENDCKYNEFLYLFNSISSILDDLATNKEANDEKK